VTLWRATKTSRRWCTTSPCTIAASDTKFIRKEDVTPEAFEREKDIYRAQAAPPASLRRLVGKIVEGKMSKFYEEVCLYEQPFIKDQTISIGQLIQTKIGKLGETSL